MITDPPRNSSTGLSRNKTKKTTCETWHVVGGEHSLKTSDPWLERFGSEGGLKIFSHRMNYSLTHFLKGWRLLAHGG